MRISDMEKYDVQEIDVGYKSTDGNSILIIVPSIWLITFRFYLVGKCRPSRTNVKVG